MFSTNRFRMVATATAVAAALFLAVPAHAQNAHGAIAFGKSPDGKDAAYGFAWNHAKPGRAQAAALNACSAAGGADCALLARFENGCGALAIDRYGRAQGKSALSQKRAEERAMRACKSGEDAGCAIVEAVCVEPGKQARTWSGSDSVLAMPAAASRPAAAEEARDAALTRADRIGVQRGLAALGFDAGLADGMFGPRTRSAIQAWQKAKGLVATGTLTRDEAQAIAAATAESEEEPAPGETPAQAQAAERLQPKCKGMVEGSKCWKEVSQRPGCHVWDTSLIPDQTVEWTGACPGGTAHGRGTVLWRSSAWVGEDAGEMVRGRKHGPWTTRTYHGRTDTNPFKVDDADGYHEGPYVDGKRHGHWVERNAAGSVHEGPYLEGEENGRWVSRWANGNRFEGEVRDGKPNGFGTYTTASGETSSGQWRDGCFNEGGRQSVVWTSRKACGFD